MAKRDKVHGEGNYEASRQYNQATKRFVESGKVEDAAREAAPADPAEAREMEQAEIVGKRRAKEEDPALRRDAPVPEDEKSSTGLRPGNGGSNTNAIEPTRAPKPGKE